MPTSTSRRGPFDPAGLLTAAAVLGRDPTFTLDVAKDVHVALPSPPDPATDPRDVIAAIVDTAHAVVRRAGAARVAEISGRVAADLGVWVDDAFVTAVVSEPDDFVWLERRSGWFYLPSVAKNSVVSRVSRSSSVAGRITSGRLHAGIRRDERMKDFVMPEYILANSASASRTSRSHGDRRRSPPADRAATKSSRPPSSRLSACSAGTTGRWSGMTLRPLSPPRA